MLVWAIDTYDGTPSQVQTFISRTSVTFPVLKMGGQVSGEYCGYTEDYFVIEQGIQTVTYLSRSYNETDLKNHLQTVTPISSPQDTETPETFLLEQNYPNPFNPSTTINYVIPVQGEVRLTVFNLLGKEVRRLIYGIQNPGRHTVTWDGRNQSGALVSTGLYIYKLRLKDQVQVRKMMFLK